MPKLIVYTNVQGRVLGAVRCDPIETESGTLQAQVPPRETAGSGVRSQETALEEVLYHEIEVPEDFFDFRPEDVQQELERRVRALTAEEG